jgi:signal transduction histidine kinase
VSRQARLQLQRIDDLLDMSDILAGTLRLKHEPFDLAEAMTAVVEFARPAAYQKHQTLVLEIDPPLQAEGVYLVRGDAERLRQVVWNLVSNAIAFTPETGRICVSLDADEGHARIVVRDSGKGIPAALLPHIFDRFCRSDVETPRTSGGGLGIGLAVAQPIVEAHGGTLSAQSEGDGRGACFVVLLPLLSLPGAGA